MDTTTRFPITFDPAYALLSSALFLSPRDSYVEVAQSTVSVRMGWGFRTTFDRSCVVSAAPLGTRVRLTRGVHGFNGRWLVNGSGDGVLKVALAPRQRAYVMGFPVSLGELLVSVEDPEGVARAMRG